MHARSSGDGSVEIRGAGRETQIERVEQAAAAHSGEARGDGGAQPRNVGSGRRLVQHASADIVDRRNLLLPGRQPLQRRGEKPDRGCLPWNWTDNHTRLLCWTRIVRPAPAQRVPRGCGSPWRDTAAPAPKPRRAGCEMFQNVAKIPETA